MNNSAAIAQETKAKILFMHIPKCGGSAINALFISPYSSVNFIDTFLPHWDVVKNSVASRDFISGHLMIKDFLRVKNMTQNAICFLVLRDPLEQLVSHIRWLDHYNDEKSDSEYHSLDIETRRVVDEIRNVDFHDPGSLDFWITHLSPKGTSYLDNLQSRFLLDFENICLSESAPLTLNFSNNILHSLTYFDFLGHMSEPEATLHLIKTYAPNIADNIPRINQNREGRSIPVESPIIRDILRKRILVDEWLTREVKSRIRLKKMQE